MDFQYKEHFSTSKVFINSYPVSAITDISMKMTGNSRNFYSLSEELYGEVIPINRGYEIKLTRLPASKDDFIIPNDGFTLSVMDADSHTIYRSCAVSETNNSQNGGKVVSLTIISNEKWEFPDFKYFGGAKCIVEM